jgi:hypothetical protein
VIGVSLAAYFHGFFAALLHVLGIMEEWDAYLPVLRRFDSTFCLCVI